MTFRSSLCSSHLLKSLVNKPYPGSKCQQLRFASISSLATPIEKTTTFPNAKSIEVLELEKVLKNDLSTAQKIAFYLRLATIAPESLAKIFNSKADYADFKRLRQVFQDASAYWSVPTIQAVMNEWGRRNVQLRLDLLTNNLIQKYNLTGDITPVINVLPTKGKRTDIMPFYNAVLGHCQRKKEYEHLRLVMAVMKERNIPLDVASYNILLQTRLTDDVSGFDMYHRLLTEGIVPNQATYNIFIKHAVQNQQWYTLKQWLDLMEEDNLEPTQVTARILFRALTKHPLENDLGQAFDRISHAIPLVEKEKFINTSASVLLKSKQPHDAIEVIHQALESDEPLSVYTYNLFLKALCNQGKLEEAQHVLDSMVSSKGQIPKADIISFTTVIHGLAHQNDKTNFKEISRLYNQLKKQGLRTNNVLQSVILYSLLRSDNLEKFTTLFNTVLKNKNKVYIPQQAGDQPLSEINVYNMLIDFYFLHYHKSKKLTNTTPQQPFDLLNEAVVQKKMKPTTSTLNIMVRGLAILNKDLNAAEKVVDLLKSKGVQVDERTVWYLTKAALRQNQLSRARQWIQYYENLGHTIQGSGLKSLKTTLNKWQDTTL